MLNLSSWPTQPRRRPFYSLICSTWVSESPVWKVWGSPTASGHLVSLCQLCSSSWQTIIHRGPLNHLQVAKLSVPTLSPAELFSSPAPGIQLHSKQLWCNFSIFNCVFLSSIASILTFMGMSGPWPSVLSMYTRLLPSTLYCVSLFITAHKLILTHLLTILKTLMADVPPIYSVYVFNKLTPSVALGWFQKWPLWIQAAILTQKSPLYYI